MALFKRKNKETPTAPNANEIGVSGDAVFGSFDHELERQDHISIKDYRRMRDTDATIDSLYNIVTLPILSATFGVRADENDKNEEQAEFIRRALFELPYKGGMDIPFTMILDQMLHAVIDGFEVFERVYKYDQETGKIVIRKLALRDATTVKIRVTEKGDYDGVHQEATFGSKTVNVPIPAHKTFLFTYGKSDNQWYGRSALRSCWKNWDKKQKLEYLDSVSIQNSAIKPKILKRIADAVVKSDDDRKKALKALSKLGQFNPAASIPYGFDVQELQGGDNSNVNESIERQNSEMARSFLASFSLLGTQGSSNTGSYALSSDQSDMFMIALKGMMNMVVDHINQYWIADLIDLNYPVGQRFYPEFYFDDLTDSSVELLKNLFTKMIDKDLLSSDVIAGIEDKIVNQFEIERIEVEKPNIPATNTGATAELSEKEDDGHSADKFRRELFEVEEKIKFNSLEKQADKVENGFEAEATPMLDDYLEKVAKNPEQKIELPEEYVNLLRNTYKRSYNYGKLSASDEEGLKSPKTATSEKEHTDQFVDFIVKKQTESIENMITEQKMKMSVSETVLAESLLTNLIKTAATSLIATMIGGTKESIFNQGMNAGRNDAYDSLYGKDKNVVYMWSAYRENSTCPICDKLDGSTYTKKQADNLPYQPGHVHRGCRCIWVADTSGNTHVTGLPDGTDEISHIQTTPKAQLRKEGTIKSGETKVNAVRREQFNQSSHGDTMSEFENNARSENVEYLAAFDKNGNKIAEITENERDTVHIPDGFWKYLADNDATVISHNHPLSLPLSPDDITLASTAKIDIHAVSEKYDFRLSQGDGEWPDMSKFLTQKDAKDWFNETFTQKAYDIIDDDAKKYTQYDYTFLVQDKATELFAKKYNLSYNKEKL